MPSISMNQKQEQRSQLFDAAVNAIVQMGNHSYQRHLNQEQADIIEAFLAFDGGDRKLLCDEIWETAKGKVEHYWREGTHDALEELRNRELYSRSYNNGMKR